MRALRSCDFCGEQAVGTFEVVPEELDPTEAERRRVMLCESCRDTLQTLIEPLIERAEGTTDGGREPQATPESGAASSRAETATDEDSTNDLIESSADEDGSLLGGKAEESPDNSGSDDAADADAEASTAPDSEDTSTESDTSSQTGQSSETVKSDKPDNYGQVLRLLRNREFPMTREEVVTIATSAYQLDARNVQSVIDEAIDRGEFVEADGQLQHA